MPIWAWIRRAEAELAARERRPDEFALRPVTATARSRYLEAWRAVQMRFVDEPGTAVRDADLLVTAVMIERGFPMDVVEVQAAADATERDGASTEDLRQAFRACRMLFERLLEDAAGESLRAERTCADGAPPRRLRIVS